MEELSRLGRKYKTIGDILWTLSIIKSQLYSVLPNELFAKITYWEQRREKLNIKEPRTFNEKLWWLRFHYRNPLMKNCSDKYAVREYLRSLGHGYDQLLLPLVAAYKRVEDINLSDFDQEVIFKLNVGSGANMIFDPSKTFDEEYFRNFFRRRIKHDYSLDNREWNFHGVQPMILVEKVLRDASGNLPVDYKFMCFDGKPTYVYYSEGVMDLKGRHNVAGTRFTNVYDMDWRLTDIEASYPRRPDINVNKPANFDDMITIARELSKPFPHVRIDLYDIDGHIYLGEFTFFHSGGCGNVSPITKAIEMGDLIRIEDISAEFLI